MSSSLVWELVKNNNAFRVVKAGEVFTSDSYSNTGRQTQSGLGFIQKQAVSIQNGKKAGQFQVKTTKKQRFVKKNNTSHYEDSVEVKHGVNQVSKLIQKKFSSRPGLVKQAQRKLVHLNRAGFRNRNAQVKQEKEAKN